MTQRAIIEYCKELGCCQLCCLRYVGLKNPSAYENAQQTIYDLCKETTCQPEVKQQPDTKLLAKDKAEDNPTAEDKDEHVEVVAADGTLPTVDTMCEEPPTKKVKTNDICVSCIGVLQEENWPQCYDMVSEILEKKRYECSRLACALSAPIAAGVRERYVTLRLQHALTHYDHTSVTPLKEAWKWTFGVELARRVGKVLDSGAVSPLLVTLHLEYPDEPQELDALKALAPALFEARRAQRRRFGAEFTRRSVLEALAGAAPAALAAAARGLGAPGARAAPVAAAAAHAPLYLGGRYLKLSRALPQTPWLVNGRRMMHSSVQEIIFEPIAALFGLAPEQAEHRLKFMSAGREDVDVRCLGDGRPFAVEITDPSREPSEAELRQLCEQISESGRVIVKSLVPVTREQLALLKKGEETKCKTYEALCIKLGHTSEELLTANGDTPVVVTARDIENINSYSNSAEGGVVVRQRTPIRVLHRRSLLTRTRRLGALAARAVPARPRLFVLRLRAAAGTYVKEWAHGELGRTRPRLADALGAPADILALDVAAVELAWPA